MLRSCSVCGRIHDARSMCRAKRGPRTTRAALFRNTYEWQQVRERVKSLDLHMCVHCRSRGVVNAHGLSVHHIVPIEEDYGLRCDEGNLATLCGACHRDAESGRIGSERIRALIMEYRGQSPPG